MKKITLFFGLVGCLLGFGQTNNVTFQVDMNNYPGAFTTPEVNGLFNGWCGNCNAMTDANNDGIWETPPIPLTDDSTEYKFSFDAWTGQEALSPGTPCTKTTGQNTNRFIVITKDTVLAPVCWDACITCTGVPSTAKVTFQLDMSDYTGSYTNVDLSGDFLNWCGGCANMIQQGTTDIYELEVVVPRDTIEFKYNTDAWTDQETLTPNSSCTITTTDATGTFTNRMFIPDGDTILPVVCWGTCESCGPISINENNWIKDFKVTPNPNNGVFDISGSLNSNENIRITVLDMQGRVIYEASELNNTIFKSIDISFSKQGMYILNISSDSNVLTEKIMYTY